MNSSFYSLNFTQKYNDDVDEEIYGSDEFRMYAYKIKRCSRMRSHDWTECPYAHRGEKAQRRDPRKVPYIAIACPAFRKGKCLKGDACELAHGVFEYWLHPARYRTRACNAGRFCQRKVCFFAHTPDQLRSESKYKCHFTYDGSSSGGEYSTSYYCGCGRLSEVLTRLKMREDEEKGRENMRNGGGGFDVSDSDLPHLDWISELVN